MRLWNLVIGRSDPAALFCMLIKYSSDGVMLAEWTSLYSVQFNLHKNKFLHIHFIHLNSTAH